MASTNLVPVKERDYLEQDLPIRGQRYVCLSFLSPEDAIRDRQVFVFNKFLGSVAQDVLTMFDKLQEKFSESKEVQDMVHALRERYGYLSNEDELQAQYDAFKGANSTLDTEYMQAHDFQTSVRGIKVRGCYDTMPEAENRVKAISKFDNKFNVYIAEVGCWCPWSPYPDDVGDSVYAETQLNTLMKAYDENIQKKDEMHMKRKQYYVSKAVEAAEEPEPACKAVDE